MAKSCPLLPSSPTPPCQASGTAVPCGLLKGILWDGAISLWHGRVQLGNALTRTGEAGVALYLLPWDQLRLEVSALELLPVLCFLGNVATSGPRPEATSCLTRWAHHPWPHTAWAFPSDSRTLPWGDQAPP